MAAAIAELMADAKAKTLQAMGRMEGCTVVACRSGTALPVGSLLLVTAITAVLPCVGACLVRSMCR